MQGENELFTGTEPAVDEVGDEDVERARELLVAADREIAAIDAAIGALGAGTFGRCEVCGEVIESRLLEERLDTLRCAQHS